MPERARASRTAVAAVLAVSVLGGACRAADDASTVTVTRPSAAAPFDGTFTWTPVTNATSYHVVVFSSQGAREFEVRDLTAAGVKLSEKVKFPPGRYFVQVSALKDGTVLAESPRTPFDMK